MQRQKGFHFELARAIARGYRNFGSINPPQNVRSKHFIKKTRCFLFERLIRHSNPISNVDVNEFIRVVYFRTNLITCFTLFGLQPNAYTTTISSILSTCVMITYYYHTRTFPMHPCFLVIFQFLPIPTDILTSKRYQLTCVRSSIQHLNHVI